MEVQRNGKRLRQSGVPLQKGPFHTLESNHIGQYCLTLFYLNDLLADSLSGKVFHIGSYRSAEFALQLVRLAKIQTAQGLVPVRRVEALLFGKPFATLFITPEGLLIRDEEQNGDLIIELME